MVMVAGGGDRKKGNLRTNHCFPEAPSRGWRGPEAEELALLAWGGRNFSCPPQQHPEHAWTSSGCFHCFVLLSKAQWDGVGPGQPLMETPSHTSAFCTSLNLMHWQMGSLPLVPYGKPDNVGWEVLKSNIVAV